MTCYKFYISLDQALPGSEEKMKVQCLASQHFPAFTIYNSVNFFADKHERGITLEIVAELDDEDINSFVRELKSLLKQEVILLTMSKVQAKVY